MKLVISGALLGLLFMGPFLRAGRTRITVRKVSTVGWHLIETGLGVLALTGFYMEFSPFQKKYCSSMSNLTNFRKWGGEVRMDERAPLILLTAISLLNSGLRGLTKDLKLVDRSKQAAGADFKKIMKTGA